MCSRTSEIVYTPMLPSAAGCETLTNGTIHSRPYQRLWSVADGGKSAVIPEIFIDALKERRLTPFRHTSVTIPP